MGNNNGTFEKSDRIGFRVIEVESGSPGQKSGLVPYSDFIVNVNGYPLHTMTKDAIEYLVKRSENVALHIQVYDITSGTNRQVEIIPSRDWSGEGLLGIVIRLEAYATDKDPDAPKEHVDIDVSFDSIYRDFEALGRERSNSGANNNSPKSRSGSQLFQRKSFSSSSDSHSPKANMTNYLSPSSTTRGGDDEVDRDGEISPSTRRNSASSKLMRVFSFSPKANTAGNNKDNSPPTEGNTPSSPDHSTSDERNRVTFSPDSDDKQQTPRRKGSKSSGVFRKFSFTSSA